VDLDEVGPLGAAGQINAGKGTACPEGRQQFTKCLSWQFCGSESVIVLYGSGTLFLGHPDPNRYYFVRLRIRYYFVRILIRCHFLRDPDVFGHPAPDPLLFCTDPNPSINKQILSKKNLDFYYFVTSFLRKLM
jgi:hypothetical protein